MEARNVGHRVVYEIVKGDGVWSAIRQSEEGVVESPGETGAESAEQVGDSSVLECSLETGKVCIVAGLGAA